MVVMYCFCYLIIKATTPRWSSWAPSAHHLNRSRFCFLLPSIHTLSVRVPLSLQLPLSSDLLWWLSLRPSFLLTGNTQVTLLALWEISIFTLLYSWPRKPELNETHRQLMLLWIKHICSYNVTLIKSIILKSDFIINFPQLIRVQRAAE